MQFFASVVLEGVTAMPKPSFSGERISSEGSKQVNVLSLPDK